MKGAFSRFTHEILNNYWRLYMQMGRVQLDSDWNENVDILSENLRTLARDVIGNGSPNDGFRIELIESLESYSSASWEVDMGTGGSVADDSTETFGAIDSKRVTSSSYLRKSVLGITVGDILGRKSVSIAAKANGSAKFKFYVEVGTVKHSTTEFAIDQDFAVYQIDLGTLLGTANPSDTVTRFGFEELDSTATVVYWFVVDLIDLLIHGGETGDPGVIYVEGYPCLKEEDETYYSQSDLLSPVALPGPPDPNEKRKDTVYLDVWLRHVTAVENGDILEPALGGADTSTRAKIVSQVRVLAGNPYIPSSGLDPAPPDPNDELENIGGGNLATTSSGAYEGSENRLYRVEIHQPGLPGVAKFKWSKDNGATVSKIIAEIDAAHSDRIEVANSSIFATGNLVEISCDMQELGDQSNATYQSSEYTTISQIVGNKIILADPLTNDYPLDLNPEIRKWDEYDKEAASSDISLGDEVKICFGGDEMQVGDYWLFTARVNGAQIEQINAKPKGVYHWYYPIATMTWDNTGTPLAIDVEDIRNTFRPLTERVSVEDAGELSPGQTLTVAVAVNPSGFISWDVVPTTIGRRISWSMGSVSLPGLANRQYNITITNLDNINSTNYEIRKLHIP